MKTDYRLFGVCIAFMALYLLSGCGNKFEQMQINYDSGNYIEAGDAAIEAFRNPNLRGAVINFMEENGRTLLEKALVQGKKVEQEQPKRNAIRFYQTLTTIIDEMASQNFPIRNLDSYRKKSETRKNRLIVQFLAEKYNEASQAYSTSYYRVVIKKIQDIMEFDTAYKDTPQMLFNAQRRAERQIAIAPFFKPADPVVQLLSDTVEDLFSIPVDEPLQTPLSIAEVEIPQTFTRELLTRLNQEKTEYLSFFLVQPDETYLDSSHYYVNGIIDAKVLNAVVTPRKISKSGKLHYRIINKTGQPEWHQTTFFYDVFEMDYEIAIKVNSNIFLTRNDRKISEINFTQYLKKSQRYRSMPEGVPLEVDKLVFPADFLNLPAEPAGIDTTALILEGISGAADKFSQEFLSLVDRDHDPYITGEKPSGPSPLL